MIIVQVVAVLAVSLTLLGVLIVAVGCGSVALLSYFGLRHDRSVEADEVIRRLSELAPSAPLTASALQAPIALQR
jgi:hypothetical protein